jgi:cytochrome c biogenesis protein CcmG/thiol:disulfide interchange protein DsbE
MNEPISTTVAPAAEPSETETQEAAGGIRWITFLVWGGIVALLAVLGWGLLDASATRPEAGATAPDFQLQFLDGYRWNDQATASLKDMRGNVVVLNFWASWCVECRLEAELLEDGWQQYRDQGVVFLGVAYVDSDPKSRAYLREFGITYPNAPDLGSAISDEYRITGVPETFFIDKEGTVRHVVIGPVSGTELHSQIAQLLAE